MVACIVDSPETRTKQSEKLADSWNVVVLNDPVNLMSYVAMVFKKVLGMNDTDAESHMLEVHEKGRSIVWTGARENAETYVYQLQEWHLNAVLEKNEPS